MPSIPAGSTSAREGEVNGRPSSSDDFVETRIATAPAANSVELASGLAPAGYVDERWPSIAQPQNAAAVPCEMTAPSPQARTAARSAPSRPIGTVANRVDAAMHRGGGGLLRSRDTRRPLRKVNAPQLVESRRRRPGTRQGSRSDDAGHSLPLRPAVPLPRHARLRNRAMKTLPRASSAVPFPRRCVDWEPRNGRAGVRLVLGLLAAALQRVPLGAEGARRRCRWLRRAACRPRRCRAGGRRR